MIDPAPIFRRDARVGKTRCRFRMAVANVISAVALLSGTGVCCNVRAAAPGVFDLVVPLANASPRLRFHEGGVAAGRPAIDPVLPAMEGAASSWYVAQWQHRFYLRPGDATRDADGALVFATADGESRLAIETGRQPGTHAYRLFENGGTLTAGGGSNLFLATDVRVPDATFARPVTLVVSAAVREASVRYDTPTAEASGAVLAMAFVGLGLLARDPASGAERFVFLQIPLVASRPRPPGPGVICSGPPGRQRLLYAPATPPDAMLAFEASAAAPRTLTRDVSADVAAMVRAPLPCGAGRLDWSRAERDPANWRLTGVYAGLEVENRDRRQGRAGRIEGQATLGLELANLALTRPAN